MRMLDKGSIGRTRAGVGALLVALALAACSGSDADGGAEPAGATVTGAAATATGTAPVSASPGAPAPALPVLASRDAAVGDIPIQVEVNELRVQGQVTRLTFTARNTAEPAPAGEVPDRWQVATFFSDGISQKKTGGLPDDAFSVDGVYLLDNAGAKRYLAGRNASQGCVCSGDLSSTFVSPGRAVVLTTVFAALPAGVSAVDVVVPRVGSFNDVPVTR